MTHSFSLHPLQQGQPGGDKDTNKKTVAILLAIAVSVIAPAIAQTVRAEGDPTGGGHPILPPGPPGFIYTLQAGEPTLPTFDLRAIYDLFTTAGIATAIAFTIGILTSVIGYFSKTAPKTFNLAKLVYTWLISLVVGILTLFAGWNYSVIYTWLANGTLTIWLYWISEGIAQKARKITEKLGWTEPATGPPTTT